MTPAELADELTRLYKELHEIDAGEKTACEVSSIALAGAPLRSIAAIKEQ